MDAGELLTNQDFVVYIGKSSFGFSKISNISAELEYESIGEGGRNTSLLFFRKPRSKLDVLTLEKGVRNTSQGVKMSLNTGGRVTGLIIGIKKAGKLVLSYTFDEGIITKVELGNLDAMGHEILIKKMEIAHTGLKQIT